MKKVLDRCLLCAGKEGRRYLERANIRFLPHRRLSLGENGNREIILAECSRPLRGHGNRRE